MHINIKKIVIRTILTIFIIFISFFIFLTLMHIVNVNFFSFKEKENKDDRYSDLFSDKSNIILTYSYDSAVAGYSYFFDYFSSEICVMELKQHKNIYIKDIKIKNYMLYGENSGFFNFRSSITSSDKSDFYISLYPKLKKAKRIDLYITSAVDKQVMEEKYFFVTLKGNVIEVSNNDIFPELRVAISEKNAPLEFLILKKNNRTYYITKYNRNKTKNNDITLLDLINIK